MMLTMIRCATALFLLAAGPLATAQTFFNAPEDHFGGADHEFYLEWLAESSANYPASLFLPSAVDPTDGASVHWRLEGDSVFLAIAVKATGFLGFGLSEVGGMFGAVRTNKQSKRSKRRNRCLL